MNRQIVRVLVVDDFTPWREFVASAFRTQSQFQIIGEASDGLEGCQKALELQPDLILLDITLPVLNGIEAARRISESCPHSKILFVSEFRIAEITEEALSTGARGFVLKSNASTELFPAMEALLSGRKFVSRKVIGVNAGFVDCVESNAEHAGKTIANSEMSSHHKAIFYSDERVLLDRLTLFIGNALKKGNAGVVLATAAHRRSLLSRLQGFGVDVTVAVEQGRYLSFDAEEVLLTFMAGGVLDQERFLSLFHNLIMTANGRYSRTALFGECVHLLWADGRAEAAIQMERLGTELAMKYEVDILCGYSLAQGEMHSEIHRLISEQHSIVDVQESL